MKSLGINLTKYIEDLFEELAKLTIEIKELNAEKFHVHEQEDSTWSGCRSPKQIYRFTAIPVKALAIILHISAKQFRDSFGEAEDPEQPTPYRRRRIKLEDGCHLTSRLTVCLQQSRQAVMGKRETNRLTEQQTAQKRTHVNIVN